MASAPKEEPSEKGANGWGQKSEATDFAPREAEKLRKEWSEVSDHVSVEEGSKNAFQEDPDHDPERPRHP